jgi:hypothetical protein
MVFKHVFSITSWLGLRKSVLAVRFMSCVWIVWTTTVPLENLRILLMHDLSYCTQQPDTAAEAGSQLEGGQVWLFSIRGGQQSYFLQNFLSKLALN